MFNKRAKKYRVSYMMHGPWSEKMTWKSAKQEFYTKGGEYIVDEESAGFRKKKVYNKNDIKKDDMYEKAILVSSIILMIMSIAFLV